MTSDNSVTPLDVKLMPKQKWHYRYLDLARHVSQWSKDPSTKCGAVLVRPDKTLASVGFNGFPRGVPDSDYLLNDREAKYERVVHAEVNAILNCPDRPVGYKLYTWPPGYGPTCARCATVVIQSGISEIVYVLDESSFAERWMESAKIGLEMYRLANVRVWAIRAAVFNAYRHDQIQNGN